jgi:hypothetical protein
MYSSIIHTVQLVLGTLGFVHHLRILLQESEVVLLRTHQSCVRVTGEATHRDALSAVLPGLQLKFQDLGCTVTNWESSR